MFRELATVHPVKQPHNLYALHHFYKVIELSSLTATLQRLQKSIVSLCGKLPRSLYPPHNAVQPGSVADCHSVASPLKSSSHPVVTESNADPLRYNLKTRFDLIPWTHFTMSTVYDSLHITPQFPVTDNFRLELSQLLPTLHKHFNFNSRLSSLDVIQGYARHTHIDGPEYILDVRYTDRSGRAGFERVKVVRQLTEMSVVLPEQHSGVNTTNIIIPLIHVSDDFVIPLSSDVDITRTNIILCVSEEGDNLHNVQRAVNSHLVFYPDSSVTTKLLPATSSLADLIEVGMALLSEEELVFLDDSKVEIHPEFIHACQRNTIIGKQVYFPIPFIAYHSTWNISQPMRRQSGRWSTDGSSNTACLYKADYILLGAAGEGKSLLSRVSQSPLEVFQVPDAGLIGHDLFTCI